MNRYIYIFIINFISIHTYAQVFESFNDSTLISSSTHWNGQLNDFKINTEHQLQCIGNNQGVSTLYTPISISSTMQWEFWIKMNFAPSESNRLRVYLQSNDTLFSNGNAFYLEIGDNGNTDAIKFYKQTKGKATLLAEGTSGAVASDPVMSRIKINKSAIGLWTLAVDYKGDHQFIEEWSILDTLQINDKNQYFGLQCLYTTTRKDKFYFDDINIHKDSIDHTPFKIVRIISDSNEVRLYLNKPVDSTAASDAENYVISNGIGQPRKVRFLQDTIIIITLFKNLAPGDYEIICKTFKDRDGIVINNYRAKWTHSIVTSIPLYDLLINEIMIDPTPVVQQPPYEYIEIYNHSIRAIDLANVYLRFETNRYTIDTSVVLLPGEYALLCESAAYESLKSSGKTIKLKKWPALRNTNGTIGLYDSRDSRIHQVIYDDSWYRDTKKRDGGWSLEMINPDNVCDLSQNWMASNDTSGGTPGKINSIYNTSYHIALALDSISLVNDNTINLYPNKLIQLNATTSFTFSPNIAVRGIAKLDAPEQINISLISPFQSGLLYSLKIKLSDCIGRSLEEISTILAKSESPALHDLVISEILFNPKTGGSNFIELYNRSNKNISPDQMIISNELTGKQQIIHHQGLILPGTYWVITPHAEYIKQNYTVPHPDQLFSNTLPTLPDDHGQISLWSKERILIDSFTYDESFQYDLLNTKDGVTIERIDLESPPIPSNWHSASGIAGYGTPTDKNSNNSLSNNSTSKSRFKLKSKVFSPNDDGIDDQLFITYELPDRDYLARVDIFDDQGRPVRKLISNLSLSNAGSVEWNGIDDHGRKSPSGIYIVSIDALNTKGQSIHERMAGVLER